MPHSPSAIRARRHLSRRTTISAAIGLLGVSLVACSDAPTPTTPGAAFSRNDDPGVHRQYGTPIKLGNGRARTYIELDQKNGGAPLEIGIALDEKALDGLPADVEEHGGESGMTLELPAQNPTPYRFAELDWNPHGHEPAGVYDQPHFDFHFYTISVAQRDAIDPVTLGDATYFTQANTLPPMAERYAFYVPVSPPGEPVTAVPHMGVHWADVRSPELQGVFGHPENARLFTTTLLHGSWNGQFIFDEPMVTRAFILGRKTAVTAASRDSVIALPSAQQYRPTGYRPAAYHVTYDAQAREYHIALTQLTLRQ